MTRLTNQTWGDVREGDVLVNIHTGSTRFVKRIDQAAQRGYLVITTDTKVAHTYTTGGHREGGELVIDRDES